MLYILNLFIIQIQHKPITRRFFMLVYSDLQRPLFEGFAAANLCFFNTINISCQFNLYWPSHLLCACICHVIARYTVVLFCIRFGRTELVHRADSTNSVRMDLVLDMVRDTKRIHVDEAGGTYGATIWSSLECISLILGYI